MSFPGDQASQEHWLRSGTPDESSFGDESLLGDSRRSFFTDDENDLQSRFLPQDAMDPFTVEGFNVKLPSSLYAKVKTSIWTCMQKKRNSTRHPLSLHRLKMWSRRTVSRRPRFSKCVLYVIMGYVLILGIIHLFDDLLEALETHSPDDMDWILNHWGLAGEPSEGFGKWPTDATADIHPVNCHSHNDYWRSVPLYAAVHAGCTGVEADVWLIDEELYVGHRTAALTENRTLRNLYISPILDIIGKQNPPIRYHTAEDYPLHRSEKSPLNGVFDVDPTQTFVLLIDFKSSGPAIWPRLDFQLTPLREKGYLTHFNGTAIIERPITIVGTGNVPFDLLTSNETYRDIFFDAPLDEMADLSSRWPNPNRAQDPTRGHDRPLPDSSTGDILDGRRNTPRIKRAFTKPADHGQGKSGTTGLGGADVYSPFNSYYASTSFTSSIGRVWGSRLTQEQLQLIRGQIRGAHQRGLKVRYWSLPQWPIGLRNHVWHILMREGVDMLNVDDLRHATGRDWRKKKGWGY